jgi:hypothetical protein
VRLLLGHRWAIAKATINQGNQAGRTALCCACYRGRGGVVRALLESGADPTIPTNNGSTPMAIAKWDPPDDDDDISAEGRRECVAELEVRLYRLLSTFLSLQHC